MNERACQEIHDAGEPDSSGIVHLPPSSGSFPLRRARYFSQTGKPPLTEEQQLALIKLARNGDDDAKRKLIAHNMQVVVDFARHYADRGPAPLDLIMAGNEGLVEALDGYTPDGGFSFLAYVVWRICENIERTILYWGKPSRRRTSRRPVDRHPAPSPHALLPNMLDCRIVCMA